MKANELRIGNFAKSNCEEIIEVLEIHSDGVYIKNSDGSWYDDLDEIQPIELTVEFAKTHIKDLKEEFIVGNVTSCRLNENISIMFVDGKMNSFYIYDYDDENDSYFSIKIKYLHELQNVFFTFTNQELEIKL